MNKMQKYRKKSSKPNTQKKSEKIGLSEKIYTDLGQILVSSLQKLVTNHISDSM